MKKLRMTNDDVEDVERCPICGKELDRAEERGDVTAYVHDGHHFDCLE